MCSDSQSHNVITRETPTFPTPSESLSARRELSDTQLDTVDSNAFKETPLLAPGILPRQTKLWDALFYGGVRNPPPLWGFTMA